MAEARYTFLKPQRNEQQLDTEVRALGFTSFVGIFGDGDNVLIGFSEELTAAQQAQLLAVVNAHTGTKRRPRKTLAIANDILGYIAVPDAQPGFVKRLAAVAAAALAGAMQVSPDLAKQAGAVVNGDEPDV